LGTRLVYLECPKCHDQIRTPFSRGGPPTVYVHVRARHTSCRLVIHVAAAGDRHDVQVVPDAVSLETALLAALQRWEQMPPAS
jgi:hypothetical protein